MRRTIIAHHHRDPRHSLPPDDADLDFAVLGAVGDDRGNSGFGKINVCDCLVRLFERGAQAEGPRHKIRPEQPKIATREHRQQLVARYG